MPHLKTAKSDNGNSAAKQVKINALLVESVSNWRIRLVSILPFSHSRTSPQAGRRALERSRTEHCGVSGRNFSPMRRYWTLLPHSARFRLENSTGKKRSRAKSFVYFRFVGTGRQKPICFKANSRKYMLLGHVESHIVRLIGRITPSCWSNILSV